MKKIIYLIMILAGGGLWAQSIAPQVINSAGMHRVSPGGMSLTDNVGEPFTTTISNTLMISQGFLQPLTLTAPKFTVDVFATDVSCFHKNDGKITTTITSTAGKYDVKYVWTPTTVCPGNNCTFIDSVQAGTYSLNIIVSYTTISGKPVSDTLKAYSLNNVDVTKPVITISDVNGPCRIRVFNGVTMNADGINDVLTIENISEFPNNRITIYNRWGAQLYDQRGYDNITKMWPTGDEGNKLVSSTYFYILDLGDGSKPIKGWIELIKN